MDFSLKYMKNKGGGHTLPPPPPPIVWTSDWPLNFLFFLPIFHLCQDFKESARHERSFRRI